MQSFPLTVYFQLTFSTCYRGAEEYNARINANQSSQEYKKLRNKT
jgi:hypothetical protein